MITIASVWIADFMLVTFIIGLIGGWLIGYNTGKKMTK